MQMSTATYINDVLATFARKKVEVSEDITDRVFLMIERDEQLIQEYRGLARDDTARRGLNSRIGRRIRERFSLKNLGRCHKPESRLIKSYERHAK
jgi:hypothetical protein